MPDIAPIYPMDEFARRGDELYERVVEPALRPSDMGKMVLLDIDSGAYEIDADELAASDRLLARYPLAQVWMRRAGSRYASRRLGRAVHPIAR